MSFEPAEYFDPEAMPDEGLAPTETVTDGDQPETEEQLVQRAQTALSECRWLVGECAAKWTQRFARGRTDADFANLLGLSADQIYQRRRVFETFGGTHDQFPNLKWSHFYAALTWDDAAHCLQWALEAQATVAEMKAWRRLQRGEDLQSVPEATGSFQDANFMFVPSEMTAVQNPNAFRSGGSAGPGSPRSSSDADDPVHAGVARQFGPDDAPFDGGQPSSGQGPASTEVPLEQSIEQVVKRMTSALDRVLKVITPEFAREFKKVPKPVRMKFLMLAAEIGARSGDLG